MAPTLPSSLSPHVLILHSPDLKNVLKSHSLPLLPQILQSFSPLQQITTRTTALTSIPLSSFALRFSDLEDIEVAIHEDEEQRAERTMDWIGSRVQIRCASWVELFEKQSTLVPSEGPWKDRTPWWEEVKRCVESDHVPNRSEGWNHPVAIIYAVSTTAANPLQALQELQSRPIDFPPWVDATFLRYSLIVHPSTSSLSDPIAESLFNAVKKQYGLHTYLLPLGLPLSPPSTPIPVSYPVLRLPPISSIEVSPMPPSQPPPAAAQDSASPPPSQSERRHSTSKDVTALSLCELDVQQLGRFTREFVTMSLIPWMEKAVVDWNELYSTSRRLPSRLFSSTRRLFGSGYSTAANTPPSSTPTHGSNSSVSSVASRVTSHAPNSSISSLTSITSSVGAQGPVLVSQHRRLAEFATILGDFKLAISIWETLRKESKGGADILPLLLAPSPPLPLLAASAIQSIHAHFHEFPAQAQMRALVHAVRWDIGMDLRDFLGNILEGERWLVQAAGAAEEVPTALLLAHAAFLSVKKGAIRRSALWYMRAADKLEKSGIKPLSMFFFRRAHQLYTHPRLSEISPSFWESEGKSPSDWRGFDAVLPGIEHELGRLLYTTGDTAGAVKHFLGLLHASGTVTPPITEGLGITLNGNSQDGRQAGPDKVYLEDFRVALKHLRTTESERFAAADLQLHLKFCHVKHTRIRLPGDTLNGDADEWKSREDDWAAFWKPKGPEKLHVGGKAAVNETFWVDLAIRNPLDVDVTLSSLTILVREAPVNEEAGDHPDFVEVEVVDDIQLGAKESRTIPVGVRSSKAASLVLTHVAYDFLGLLPSRESLATRGRRLHDTPQQRQNKVYAPNILLRVDVEDALQRLQANFVDGRHVVLAEGETKRMTMRLLNSGKNPISELWVLGGSEDELWVDDQSPSTSAHDFSSLEEVVVSSNSLSPREAYQIPLENVHSSSTLAPGDSIDVPLVLHASQTGDSTLCILLTFREAPGQAFHSTRLVRQYEVRPIFSFSTVATPHRSTDHEYTVGMEVENKTTSSVRFTQVTSMSPLWVPALERTSAIGTLPPNQTARTTFIVDRSAGEVNIEATRNFVLDKLTAVLHGSTVEETDPPSIQLQCRHLPTGQSARSLDDLATRHFIHAGRRNHVLRHIATQHPHIPRRLHHFIFPLYNPASLDLVVFWEISSQNRRGHILLPFLNLGAEHAPLTETLQEVEQKKVKRSMYAETHKERQEAIAGIRNSEWNAEMNPISVSAEENLTIKHDFKSGNPCHAIVAFTLQNHSLTNPTRFVLTLPSVGGESSTPSLPRFVGRLTHRGQLLPSETTRICVRLLIPNPGIHIVTGWTVETEVGEPLETSPWSIRQCYKEVASAHEQCSISAMDESRT